jgi:hypothetical protein
MPSQEETNMSASNPRFRPANLLLIGWIGFLCAASGSAPATAQPLEFGIPARTFSAWIHGFSRWINPAEEPTPPESGTCIDPNGKPRPCDSTQIILPKRREAGRSTPPSE